MTRREQKLKKSKMARLIIGGAFLVVVSVGVFLNHFTRQKITALSDLQSVQGPLQRYSFRDGFRGSHYYYIFLNGDGKGYEISANFLGCFDKDGFQSTVTPGDVLRILFDNNRVIFSISDSRRSYLSGDSAIAEYNGGTDIRVGVFMFLFGSAALAAGLIQQRNPALLAKMARTFSKSTPAPIAIALIVALSLAAILWMARYFGL